MIRNEIRQDHCSCRALSHLAGAWAGGGYQESPRRVRRRQRAKKASRGLAS